MARTAWDIDLDKTGYGKHEYREIDPDTVNPEEYARGLRGEESYYGDVREYNTAANSKHPENNLDLYDCSLLGTVFETDHPSWQGRWTVVDLPKVIAPDVYVVAKRDGDTEPQQISAVDLGIKADGKNLLQQVVSKLVKRGLIDREQRKTLKLGKSTRERLKEQLTGKGDVGK